MRRHPAHRFARCGLPALGATLLVSFALAGPAVASSPHIPLSSVDIASSVEAVSCAATASCTAVGSYLPFDKDSGQGDPDGDVSISRAFVESSAGGGWVQAKVPSAAKGSVKLYAVSCAAAGSCISVGSYEAVAGKKNAFVPFHALAEQGQDRSWKVLHPPAPSASSLLDGISCPSTSSCFAAGYSQSSRGGTALLIEHFDGKSWHVVSTSAPSGRDSALSGVSCPTASSCVAVDSVVPPHATVTETVPLALVLSGGHWSTAEPPLPAKSTGTLQSVACSAAGACVANGSTEKRGTSVAGTLVVALGGGSWRDLGPAASNPPGAVLQALSCTAGQCYATGWSINATNQAHQPLIARVGPTSWSVITTAATYGSPLGVSCRPGPHCTAVGSNVANPELWFWGGGAITEGTSAGCVEDLPCAGS